jgi:type IV pilus assembly protein PilM
MRPVFNDLQTELQRSLGFFTNLDRTAKIGRVVAMGNAFKLPGLRRYLAQSLGFDIERVDSFRGLVGPEVLVTPAFKDNILSFGVCYGLCLQALQTGGLRTNLLPKEITMDRLIRRKKPWAVAAAAVVMLACTVSYAAYSLQYSAVKESSWKTSEDQAKRVEGQSKQLIGDAGTVKGKFEETKKRGDRLVSNLKDRTRWLEFITTLNTCLPMDEKPMPETSDLPAAIMSRKQLVITNIDSQQVEDVGKWFSVMNAWYRPVEGQPGAPKLQDAGGGTSPGGGGEAPGGGPTGPGTIVQICGRHYHNAAGSTGAAYIYATLIKELASQRMYQLGVSYPVLVKNEPIVKEEIVIPGPKRKGAEAPAPRTGLGGMGIGVAPTGDEKKVMVNCQPFRVQFVWQPKLAGQQPAGAANAVANSNLPGAVPPPAAQMPGAAANAAPGGPAAPKR